MSYDLYVLPLEPGQDPDEALEADAEESDGEARQRNAELAEALRARHPELEPFEVEDSIELTAPEELPLQILLSANQAALSVPYWDLGERTGELVELLVDCARTIVTRTGWSLYDPQEGRVVMVDDLPAVFHLQHGHGVEIVKGLEAEEHGDVVEDAHSGQRAGFLSRLFGRG